MNLFLFWNNIKYEAMNVKDCYEQEDFPLIYLIPISECKVSKKWCTLTSFSLSLIIGSSILCIGHCSSLQGRVPP